MSKPAFSSSLRGYDREEVDAQIGEQLAELSILRQMNKRLTTEALGLRSDVSELRKKVKSSSNMGYADLGSQFESTLRLAEEQARKLLQDAGLEAIKIRDTASAEGDRAIRRSEKLAEKLIAQAEAQVAKSAKELEEIKAVLQAETEQSAQKAADNAAQAELQVGMILAKANEESTQLKVNAQLELDRVRALTDAAKVEAEQIRAQAQQTANARIAAAQEEIARLFAEMEQKKSDADAVLRELQVNIASQANELEMLTRRHQQAVVDFELELAEKRTQAEVESGLQYERSLEQIKQNNLKAEEILAAATERARDRTARAEAVLRESEDKAMEIVESSHSNAFHLLSEARRRSEILSRKAETYSLAAIRDAEDRLGNMQSEYEDLTEFVDSLKSMMSTDAILAVVESSALEISAKEKIKQSREAAAANEPVEAELVEENN